MAISEKDEKQGDVENYSPFSASAGFILLSKALTLACLVENVSKRRICVWVYQEICFAIS